MRMGNLKLIEFFEDGRLELYDLGKDIGENHDLTAARPDSAHPAETSSSASGSARGARNSSPVFRTWMWSRMTCGAKTGTGRDSSSLSCIALGTRAARDARPTRASSSVNVSNQSSPPTKMGSKSAK